MKKKVFFGFLCGSFLFCLLAPVSLSAQTSDPGSDIKSFRLFEDESIVEITLKFDLSTYFREKPQDAYLKANITFHISKSDSVSRDIKLKTRGVFRNGYCTFAPIELNFKKANFGYSDLDKISKIKLVPQCSSGKEKEDYVVREYIAYKLFNRLTDTSYRVRLLRITYIDSEKKKKQVSQLGFFIEPVEMITSRTNTVQVRSLTLNQKSIVPAIMDRLALFNFLIGNYDWAVPGQHNILVLRTLNPDPYGFGIAVPHDFDWTGLVNPVYAVPAENIGTESVRERLFEGVCRTKEIFRKRLDLFSEKKEELYSVINNSPYLSQKVKKDMTGYLDGFYNQLGGKRDLILNTLMNTCKQF